MTAPEPEHSGERAPDVSDPRVAEAMRRIDELPDRPLAEHVEVYEDVHRTLQDVLAEASRRDDDPSRRESEPDGPDGKGDAGP